MTRSDTRTSHTRYPDTSREALILPLAILLTLAACRTNEAASDSVAPFSPTCDEAVYLPISLLDLEGTTPADRHAEAYGAAPAPFQVTLGWPDADPSRSVSVVWRTDMGTTASVIEWGTGGQLTERAEGYTYVVGTGDTAFRVHEVKLCGRLTPGTAVTYRVGGPGAWSPSYTFTTPGTPDTFDTFRVVFAGDSRGAPEVWGTLVQAAEQLAPDLYLFSGDMVNMGTTQSEWDAWFAATGDTFARKPFLPAAGNHELLATNYFAQFSLPGREVWWQARFGTLRVAGLTDLNIDEDTVRGEEAQFLRDTFASDDAPWRVALHHSPVYTSSTNHASNTTLQEAWAPIYEAQAVDLVVNGHNHLYERSVPIKAGAEVPAGQGPVYLVTGGAGAPLYTGTRDEWYNAVANPVEHFVVGDFSPQGASFAAYDVAGNVIDTFTLPVN